MAKGSAYEREISKLLSLWWSGGARDDVFYRSQASGARGTVRRTRTAGAHGDIAAVDPCGLPLTDLFTFEIKRGYSTRTVADLFDITPANKLTIWETWLYKAHRDATKAGSAGWALITRRNLRNAALCMPRPVARALAGQCGYRPDWSARVNVRYDDKKLKQRHTQQMQISGGPLAAFLDTVSPDDIRAVVKQL